VRGLVAHWGRSLLCRGKYLVSGMTIDLVRLFTQPRSQSARQNHNFHVVTAPYTGLFGSFCLFRLFRLFGATGRFGLSRLSGLSS
jgi:hypothetical protein